MRNKRYVGGQIGLLDLANEYTGFEVKLKFQISTECRGTVLWSHHHERLRQKEPTFEPHLGKLET